MTYDRNQLAKTVTGSTTVNRRYDPFGRATTSDVGPQVVEQNAYDGYDRLTRQQKFDTTGTPTFTRNQTYDPFDRVSSQSEKVGANASITTRYTFVGLANQVAIEQEQDTAGTWKTSKSYAYGAGGENLSLVDSPVNGTTSKKSFYGTNPHGDVETLTDATTGTTTSTYRYTAYGQPDKKGTTGDDAIQDDAAKDADIVNPYRFNSARFNGATGTYDMGFREYNPGLNRFLTRDMFNGALSDLDLGTDPWNANRYMFGGGNPISRVELDGHMNAIEDTGGGLTPRPTPPPVTKPTPPPAADLPEQPSAGEKFGQWLVEKPLDQRLAEEVVIKPIQETYEACKAAVMTGVGSAGWQQCQIRIGLTALGFTGGGKIVGIGVRSAEGLAAARAGSPVARLFAGRAIGAAGSKAAELPKANATVRDLLKLVPGNAREADKAAMASGRTDQQLLESVFRPSDGQSMALYPDGRTLAHGNHRLYELLDRARDPLSNINWDTPIFIQGWKP